MQKRLEYLNWVPQPDGSYLRVEVPGPPSLDSWELCWGIFETILFMIVFPPAEEGGDVIPVLEPIAAETYLEAFRTLAKEHPECWHLCCRAEDRARAEHVPRTYRKLKDKLGTAPSWSQVFIEVAEDNRFWDQEVRRPALQFLARNKKPVLDDEIPSFPPVPPPAAGAGRPPRDRKRRANTVNLVPNNNNNNGNKKGKGKGGGKGRGGPHPRKDGRGKYITTRDGAEICFGFANRGPEGCSTPCPAGRAHVCQKCLQPHHNDSPSCRANS